MTVARKLDINWADVCVVIPVYNRAKTVLNSLESVCAQRVPPRQVIVVDDGSDDGLEETLKRWLDARSLPFAFEVVKQSNQGVAVARNRGLRSAQEVEYIAFLDSDDTWPSDFLSRACQQLDQYPEAVAATTDRKLVGPYPGSSRLIETEGISGDSTLWLLEKGGGISSSSVLRKAPVDQLGGFDGSILTGEDSALFLRLSLLGSWVHLPGAPILTGVGTAESCNETPNLSAKYTDNKRRWTRVYEAFLEESGWNARPMRKRQLMSWHWYRSGKELVAAGQNKEAARCFRKALQWWPIHWKSLMRLFMVLIPAIAP